MITAVKPITSIQSHTSKSQYLKHDIKKGGDVQKENFHAILQQALNSTNERK